MYKILIPEDIAESGKRYLTDRGYTLKVGVPTDIPSLKKEIADADGIIVRNASYPKEVFEGAKRLKVIARHGIGVDNIDVAAANAQGIWVVNGPGSNSNAVAEHTVATIAALFCRLRPSDLHTRKGDWSYRLNMERHEMKGAVLGLIGFGNIGRMVAEKAAAGFGMEVIAYDVGRAASEDGTVRILGDLDEVLAQSDVVSLHIPCTEDTRGLFDYDRFMKMKEGSFFVDHARGELYVEEDLVRSIEEGHLAGAALDVYREEPLRESRLFELEQVI